MFKSTDLGSIDSSIENIYQKLFRKKTENLRNFILDSPTQYQDVFLHFDLTKLVIKTDKLNHKLGLAILSWYFPEEIRFLVQLQLDQSWGANLQEVKEILLTSKDLALAWLIRCSDWTESEFFGNIIDKGLSRMWSLTEFARVSRSKVERYSGYCRGYQESNRGVPSPLSVELRQKLTVDEDIELKLVRETELFTLIQRVKLELYFLTNGQFPVEILY